MTQVVKVALIGDSIRLHAEPFIRDRLPALFQVTSPTINCRSSHEVARSIRDWIPPGTADIVHINCGLHDIRHDPGRSRPASSLQEYAANLRSVFTYLAATGASVIWATSTPVSKHLHDSVECHRWYRADLVRYNRLSVGLALGFGFQINDLYGRLAGPDVEELFLPDGVHFNHAGNQSIGNYVATAIQACSAC